MLHLLHKPKIASHFEVTEVYVTIAIFGICDHNIGLEDSTVPASERLERIPCHISSAHT